MEIEKLAPAVLMLVCIAILIGVGVLLLDIFADTVKNNDIVRDENVSITAGTDGSLVKDEIVELLGCVDATNRTSFTLLTCNISNKETGKLRVPASSGNINANVNYTYQIDTRTTTALMSGASAVGTISNSWMTLIVTIIVLSLILFLVIKSFMPQR